MTDKNSEGCREYSSKLFD